MEQKGNLRRNRVFKALNLLVRSSRWSLIFLGVGCAAAADDAYLRLQPPVAGDHALHILSPRLLELELINTKQADPARVDAWDWVNDAGSFVPPDLSSIRVIVNGQANNVTGVGFKRRPRYAPLEAW